MDGEGGSPEMPAQVQRAKGVGRLRRVGIVLLITLVVTYVTICVVIFATQRHLIYFPSSGYTVTPEEMGLSYEAATLTTSDGESIAAWYVSVSQPRATILFCHGNAGNMAERCPTLKTFSRLGYDVLIFDYRGYGASTGVPSEAGLYCDADAAWQYLTVERQIPPQRIVVFGRSLGGAVAIDLATRHTPAALVVECTFTSMVDIGQREYPLLPVGLLCTHRYESVKKVPNLHCPKLFFHGMQDELIPLDNARRLFAAAAEPKQFIATGGGHNEAGCEYNAASTQQLGEWLASALTGNTP